MSRSFSTLWGSLSQSCIRTKGSLPFRLSLCHGLGLERRSDTEPCVRPRMLSPNSRWPGGGEAEVVSGVEQRDGRCSPPAEQVHPISQPASSCNSHQHPQENILKGACIYRNWGAGSMQSHQHLPKTWAERGSAPKLLSVKTSLTFLVME